MMKEERYDMAHRSRSRSRSHDSGIRQQAKDSSFKSWLLRNVAIMTVAIILGFLFLVISFETQVHQEKKEIHNSLRENHQYDALHKSVNTIGKRSIGERMKQKRLFHWKPIDDGKLCSSKGMRLDPFPPSFDLTVYQKIYGAGRDYSHYVEVGRKQGWECTRGQRLKEIINLEILPKFLQAERRVDKGMVLEIGPFLNPMIVGPGVRYLDVMDMEALKQRAKNVGYPEINSVNIDFVSPTGDLSMLPEKSFSLIASSNVLSNQADLIRHLLGIQRLLLEGGYYAMTVADKRFTFDHYLPDTTIATVLDDYYESRGVSGFHKLSSVIEHRSLVGHNDVAHHWKGAHGAPYSPDLERMKLAVKEYQDHLAANIYIDVHNYHFTPQGLAFIVDTLYNLGLTEMRVHRLYDTLDGHFEFGIVLKRCTPPKNEAAKTA